MYCTIRYIEGYWVLVPDGQHSSDVCDKSYAVVRAWAIGLGYTIRAVYNPG